MNVYGSCVDAKTRKGLPNYPGGQTMLVRGVKKDKSWLVEEYEIASEIDQQWLVADDNFGFFEDAEWIDLLIEAKHRAGTLADDSPEGRKERSELVKFLWKGFEKAKHGRAFVNSVESGALGSYILTDGNIENAKLAQILKVLEYVGYDRNGFHLLQCVPTLSVFVGDCKEKGFTKERVAEAVMDSLNGILKGHASKMRFFRENTRGDIWLRYGKEITRLCNDGVDNTTKFAWSSISLEPTTLLIRKNGVDVDVSEWANDIAERIVKDAEL